MATLTILPSIDEDDLASNSATRVPTQQSVKAYVDANVGTGSAPVDTSSGNYQIGSDEFQVRLRAGASDPVLPLGDADNDGQWYVIENYSGAARTPTTLSAQTLEASSLIPIGERRAFAWDNVASTWRVM